MAYQWELGEDIETGIHRIITEQINHALSQLKDDTNDRDEAVHEARKSFKKIRAVLRLVRDEVGEDYYQEKNIFYRDLGRELSPLRDAYMMVEVMDNLIKELDDKTLKKTAKSLRKQLIADYKEIQQAFWASGQAVSNVIEALETESPNVEEIPISHDSFKAFKKGLRRVYKRGQDRMTIAYDNVPSPEGFHDWRKRVKYLWYHMRLLEPVYPAHFTALIAQLDELADLLGVAHDMAVLYDYLEALPETDDGNERLLLAYLDHKRGELEISAQPFGEAIFADDPKTFAKQIKKWWKNPQPIIA
ncbi:MAG: CHAD domain-containing protein [Chloroflexota bacterium]